MLTFVIKASVILFCWPPLQMSLLFSELACSSGTLARWGCCVFHILWWYQQMTKQYNVNVDPHKSSNHL